MWLEKMDECFTLHACYCMSWLISFTVYARLSQLFWVVVLSSLIQQHTTWPRIFLHRNCQARVSNFGYTIFLYRISEKKTSFQPFIETNFRKLSSWFWREINAYGGWMEDGVTTANTGPTHNKSMDSGAHLCPCVQCVVVHVVFALFMKLFH